MFVKTITVLSALVAVNAAACKRPSASSSVKLNSTLSSNSTATATNVELGYAAAATSGAVSQNASSVWGVPSTSTIATSTSVIPSSTSSQAPATSSASSSGSGDYSGTATYYAAGLGACGWTNSGSDYIVAMNQAQYSGDTCGKNIQITDPSTGRTATAQIADLCPSCAYGDLDMSTGLFSYLHNGNMDAGIFEMTWSYV